MDAMMIWLNGKKTYLTALVILVCGILDSQGITVPEYVWAALAAMGLGFLRVGVTKNGPAPTNNMVTGDKAKTLPFLVGGLGLSLVLMGGCSGTGARITPSSQYKLASTTYATTMNVLSDLRDNGYLTTAQRQTITGLSNKADAILDEMEKDVISGNTFDFPYLMMRVDALLDELLRMQLQGESVKKTVDAVETAKKAGKEVSYDWRRTCPDSQRDTGWRDAHHDVYRDDQQRRNAYARADSPGDSPPQTGQGPVGRWRTPCPAPSVTVAMAPEVEYD